MKKYKFLIKPFTYILSLIFSSWMILEIDRYGSKEKNINGKSEEKNIHSECFQKKDCLKKLFILYSNKQIDSASFENELEKIIHPDEIILADKK